MITWPCQTPPTWSYLFCSLSLSSFISFKCWFSTWGSLLWFSSGSPELLAPMELSDPALPPAPSTFLRELRPDEKLSESGSNLCTLCMSTVGYITMVTSTSTCITFPRELWVFHNIFRFTSINVLWRSLPHGQKFVPLNISLNNSTMLYSVATVHLHVGSENFRLCCIKDLSS